MLKAAKRLITIFGAINGWYFATLILVFVLGWQLGHRDYSVKWQNYQPDIKVVNQQPPPGTATVDFKLFWDTWNLVSEKYIDKKAIDPQKLYYGAIQGMVAAVGDPYTVFLPPEAQKATKEQLGGSFDGVGMRLELNKDKRLVVTEPLKGTPADRAGVLPGDLIIEINGKDTNSLSLPEAVSMIRGPRGSEVSLALFRENQPKPIEIKLLRDKIIVKSAEYSLKTTPAGKKIAYLHISQFGERTKQEWDEAVSEALAAAPQGVVLDVRSDPGGFLDASVYIASEFLDGGVVVMQEGYQGDRRDLKVVRNGKMLKLPLVVLINKGSASASEILAGAIQDRKRGKLIGEQSFGKGTIQSAEDLASNTGIHITTAKWLTPNGRWIHNVGLTPDIKVEIPVITEKTESEKKDLQLEKALETLDLE